MNIELAGFNADASILPGDATPETISAAYARISRSEKNVSELRKDSLKDIPQARKSNSQITYGFGHFSIAEHAVFNFDLVDISRLAMEYIQRHRLISFTEKSQRYVKIKSDDGRYLCRHIPHKIILANTGHLAQFVDLTKKQFEAYAKIYNLLIAGGLSHQQAQEDARYVLPLSTYTQAGMTINARQLEHLIVNLYSHGVEELTEIAHTLLSLSSAVTPSLIKYVEPSKFLIQKNKYKSPGRLDKMCSLINYTTGADNNLLFRLCGPSLPFNKWEEDEFMDNAKERFEDYMKDFGQHDTPPREFEFIDLTYSLGMSASCYSQLKRHRITTQIPYGYTTDYIIPDSISKYALKEFCTIMTETIDIYRMFKNEFPPEVCEYLLANANVRKVLLKTNARELYHIARLRLDPHAQWEIRELVGEMVGQAQKVMPLTFSKIGTKQI